ncbi:alpha/beta hydrolase-fold protein [Oceanibium sediminis]|uniref:alpha/beta hydrolase-fold protein n=1 Tax=Oceanibium sediminis TaxID=2026339 RepID=UPI000DD3B477|nr:alpha/beta hydrolase-fold protein [Oceanibium sediminis]
MLPASDAPDIARHHPALAELLAGGPPPEDKIAAFLEDEDIPLIEPGAATFLWYGKAEKVALLRWIATEDRDAFTPIPGTDLWSLRIPVSDEGRFEYKIAVTRNGGEEWMLDPLNPARAGDPFGENSVCRTYGYARPAWSKPQGAPRGHIEDLPVDSAVFAEVRREKVYLPAGHDPAVPLPLPLLIIHDGEDYASYADLTVSLDNLIADGDIPPICAVLIQAGDRMDEYPHGRRHARYIVGELLPALDARYCLSAAAKDRVLMGASLGAVASLATAFRYPGLFGGLVLKSGSFILAPEALAQRDSPVFDRVARLVQVIQRAPELPPTRAFVSTGELEGLADENRALASFLRERGVDVLFQSTWDGHHWHNWRDQLRDGLMWVLDPPTG